MAARRQRQRQQRPRQIDDRVSANGHNRYVADASGRTFNGVYQEASATDAASAGTGNYVRFSGLTGDLALRLGAITTSSATRPMISGIQIVGTRAGGASPNASAQTLLSAADLGACGGIYVPDGGGEDLLFDPDSGDFSPAGDDGWIIDDGTATPTGSIAW